MSTARQCLLYVWPRMFIEQPGLGHMKELARTLIAEATMSGRTALLPPLIANKMHNPQARRRLKWADYYDWSTLSMFDPDLQHRAALSTLIKRFPTVRLLAGAAEPKLNALKEDLVIRHFSGPSIFGEWLQQRELAPANLHEPAFSEHYPTSIWEGASDVVQAIGPLRGVIHIRRGDLACPETEPDAVITYLQAKGASPDDRLFVLTNERDPGYHDRLRATFPLIIFEQDVPALQHADNYRVFRLGKCLQSRFDRLNLGTLRFMRDTSPPKPANRWVGKANRIIDRLATLQRIVSFDWVASVSQANEQSV